MADAQTIKDAAALRAAATEIDVTGNRLSNACEQIIVEEKAEADKIAFERMRAALDAEKENRTNVYDDLRNGIIR